MGRSRRKALPEVLRDLRPEDIPEGYGDFWHGEGNLDEETVNRLHKTDGKREMEGVSLLYPLLRYALVETKEGSEKLLSSTPAAERDGAYISLATELAKGKMADDLREIYNLWKNHLDDTLLEKILSSLQKRFPRDPENALRKIWADALVATNSGRRYGIIAKSLPVLLNKDLAALTRSIPSPRRISFQVEERDLLENPLRAQFKIGTLPFNN